MQCPDCAHVQGADPVIKRLKVLMEEFEGIAPNKEQLNSELAEVKNLCQYLNLLEIVNGFATRDIKDQTGRKTYARLVPAVMGIELFKRVHGHNTGHFGYAKIYPLFSERYFWHGMATDIGDWLQCCELCQQIKPGDGKVRYALVQEVGALWHRSVGTMATV